MSCYVSFDDFGKRIEEIIESSLHTCKFRIETFCRNDPDLRMVKSIVRYYENTR